MSFYMGKVWRIDAGPKRRSEFRVTTSSIKHSIHRDSRTQCVRHPITRGQNKVHQNSILSIYFPPFSILFSISTHQFTIKLTGPSVRLPMWGTINHYFPFLVAEYAKTNTIPP